LRSTANFCRPLSTTVSSSVSELLLVHPYFIDLNRFCISGPIVPVTHHG
jgi:hypothetical protein